LLQANPRLAKLISGTLDSAAWIRDLSELRGLESYADDAGFRREFLAVKRDNKIDLAALIEANAASTFP